MNGHQTTDNISIKSDKRLFSIIFIILLSLHALLVVSTTLFPFADVPSHLAEGEIFRHYGQNTNEFSKYYTLHYLFYPNTFHLFFFSLPIFSTVESANRFLHLIAVVGLPVLVYFIIRAIKGNPWFTIAAFVLVYNYNLTFGFTNNAVANDAMLLILWLWLRTVGSPKHQIAHMLGISILLIIIYFLHAMVALFCGLMLTTFLVYKYKDNIKSLLLNSLYLVPLGLLIINWWFVLQKSAENSVTYTSKEVSTLLFMKEYYLHDFWLTYLSRGRFLVADNSPLFSGYVGKVAGFGFAFIILLPFLLLIYRRLTKKIKITTGLLYDKNNRFHYILLFLAVNSICYFFLPDKIPGQEPLYERFSTTLLLALLFIGSKLPEINRKFFAYATVIIATCHLLLWAQYLVQFNQQNADFAQILPQDNSKVLSYMNYDPAYRGRMMYDHFQNYFIVKKQGITTSRIIDYRFGMIRRTESNALPPQNYMYNQDNPRALLQRADYILVRGIISPDHQRILDSLHTFHLVRDVRNWHLLQRNGI